MRREKITSMKMLDKPGAETKRLKRKLAERPPTSPKAPAPEQNSPEIQLASFTAKYSPEIASRAEAVLTRLRKRLPNALELVYDNYNALAIGFGPTERASDAIFSVALYPKWVSLFFLQAKSLPDPGKILRGSGTVARHVVLDSPAALDTPAIRALMDEALERAAVPLDPSTPHGLIIRSISAKQRPRRPAAPAATTRARSSGTG